MMIVLKVDMLVKPGTEEKCREYIRILQEHSRREPGCLMYIGHQSTENPRKFLFYEQYKDEAAVQPANHILLEVRGVAVGLNSGFIFILLVEEEFAWIFRGLMADVHKAARLLARVLLQDANVFAAFFFGPGFDEHVDLEDDHRAFTFLCDAVFSAEFRISAANSGSIMVWSRSGPVETMPILAPLSRSMKRRYSCARLGSWSKLVMPSVDSFQPGIFS